MTHRLRQVLTIFLLLLFAAEHVGYTSVAGGPDKDGVQFSLSQQKDGLISFDLLAEENEARDNKGDVGLDAMLCEGSISMDFNSALLTAESDYNQSAIFLNSGSLPRYKFLCSFLI